MTAAGEFDVTIGAALGRGGNLRAALASCDVLLDFSSHAATRATIEAAIEQQKPTVLGVTGHSAAEREELVALAAKVPCVWTGNFSVGVNLLYALTRHAATVLGSDYDAELIETHHRFKKDAPSGTALRLLEIIVQQRQLAKGAARHGRHGIGER